MKHNNNGLVHGYSNRAECPKFLLDTNIWRYIVDNKAQGKFIKFAKGPGINVQVAPSCLYEVMRMQKGNLRSDQITLMTNPNLSRLMPEVYSECAELLMEIKRCRPHWLKKQPDLTKFNRLYKFWSRKSGGRWSKITQNSYLEAQNLKSLEGSSLNEIRKNYKDLREKTRKNGPSHNIIPLDRYVSKIPKRIAKKSQYTQTGAWREESFKHFTTSLLLNQTTYTEWLEPLVDLNKVISQFDEWEEFWAIDVSVENLPREWLRWAHLKAQSFRKPTGGSPGDNQLFSYILETDFLLSSDKVFIDLLNEIKPHVPFSYTMPQGRVLPAGNKGVEELFQYLTEV